MTCERIPYPIPVLGGPHAALVALYLVERFLLLWRRSDDRLVITWMGVVILAQHLAVDPFYWYGWCYDASLAYVVQWKFAEAFHQLLWVTVIVGADYLLMESWRLWKRRRERSATA